TRDICGVVAATRHRRLPLNHSSAELPALEACPWNVASAPQRVPVILPDQINRSVRTGRGHRVGREHSREVNPCAETAAECVTHQPIRIPAVPRGDPCRAAGTHGDRRKSLNSAPSKPPPCPG